MKRVKKISKSERFTARVLTWSQRMRHEGDDDIANLLAAAEMAKRHKPRKPKAKSAIVSRYGMRVRGGQGSMNLNNPDVRIEEIHEPNRP